MDGSLGQSGTVLDLWQQQNDAYNLDFIYSCGPLPLLQEVQSIARKHRLAGEVSLEERMGCGVGVCLSCVCDTTSGNQRVCKEGPVFNLNEVIFNEEKLIWPLTWEVSA